MPTEPSSREGPNSEAVRRIVLPLFSFAFLLLSACNQARDEYFDDGKLKRRSEYGYWFGRLDGAQYLYSPSGHLRSIVHYVDNRKVGRECSYYESGGLLEVNEWVRPTVTDPSFRVWGNEPVLVRTATFYQNTKAIPGRKLILCSRLDESLSQLSEETSYNNGRPNSTKTYESNGKLKTEFTYLKNGDRVSNDGQIELAEARKLVQAGKSGPAADRLALSAQAPNISADGIYHLGNLYLLLNRPSEALPLLTKAVALRPLNFEARKALLLTLKQLDMNQEYKNLLKDSAEVLKVAVDQDTSTKSALELSRIYRELGLPKDALEAIRVGLEKDPSDTDLLREKLVEYDRLGETSEAIPVARQLYNELPSDIEVAMSLGRLLSNNGDFSGANEALQRVVALAKEVEPSDKRYDRIPMKLGHTYELLNDTDSKISMLSDIIEKKLGGTNTLIYVAAELDNMGEREWAINILNTAKAAGTTNRVLLYNLSEALYISGSFDEAERNLRLAIDQVGANSEAHALLAHLFLVRQQFDAALNYLDEWAKPGADLPLGYIIRSQVLKSLGRDADAASSRSAFKEAMQEAARRIASPSPIKRREAIWHLGMTLLASDEPLSLIKESLSDPNNDVVIHALWALGINKEYGKQSEMKIRALLSHKNRWVRLRAIGLLADLNLFSSLTPAQRQGVQRELREGAIDSQLLVRRWATRLSRLFMQ